MQDVLCLRNARINGYFVNGFYYNNIVVRIDARNVWNAFSMVSC